MNILFLNSLQKSKWGGGEKWMILAGKGLSLRGHRVIIACQANSVIEHKTIESGLEVLDFSIPMDVAIWKIPVLQSILRKHEIEVLICCQNKDVKVGAKAARQIGIKGIFSRQGVRNLSDKKKYIRPFTKYIDGIITNTMSIKREYESYRWFPANFIHVVYNGVVVPENLSGIDLRKTYGLPQDCKIVFTAGRIDHQKGFDLLIQVARICLKNQLNWQFLIAGEGKLKGELISKCDELGVKELVHFIGFSDQIPVLLASSDVFVLPSRFEGMPNALLEAMAAGKASVASNVNGAPELVEDGVSGYLVESENIQQLFEKLQLLLSDETSRLGMELKARERVKDHFTVDRMIDQLETIFQDQLAKT